MGIMVIGIIGLVLNKIVHILEKSMADRIFCETHQAT